MSPLPPGAQSASKVSVLLRVRRRGFYHSVGPGKVVAPGWNRRGGELQDFKVAVLVFFSDDDFRNVLGVPWVILGIF